MHRLYTCALVFVTQLVGSCSFSGRMQKKLLHSAEASQYDAIIVPGIPYNNGHWDRIMKARVYWAKYLFDRGIAKNIIFSGNAVHSRFYEGTIMAMHAVALGVPAAHVYADTLAEHSTENVYYSYRLGRKLGFEKMALASDPFQTKLLRGFCRKYFPSPIDEIPFVMDTLKKLEPQMVDPVIDSMQAVKPGFVPLEARTSFRERWRGTRGKNIRKDVYE